jgi:hypothetical protein
MAAMRPATPAVGRWLAFAVWGAYVPAVSPYLSQKLTWPLLTKDGGTLRTVKDARAYMLALSKQRETRAQLQQAAELLLDGATVADSARRWSWRYSAMRSSTWRRRHDCADPQTHLGKPALRRVELWRACRRCGCRPDL